MPVTTTLSRYRPEPTDDLTKPIDTNGKSIFDHTTEWSRSAHDTWSSREGFYGCEIMASSIDPKKTIYNESVCVYRTGFVQGILRTFNEGFHLVIRPDDVWQAIISQFSLFINGGENAEHLRHMFFSHEGKKTLALTTKSLSELDSDFGKVATSFIRDNVNNPELLQWMLPNFSTTTDDDKAVAAFGMMGTMQKYAQYGMGRGPGFTSVTLLGSQDDWEELEHRVDKLDQYGEECRDWAILLRPIMSFMKRTFDEPGSQEIQKFWREAAWNTPSWEGPGAWNISGWITAFAYFQNDGSVNVPADWRKERRLALGKLLYPVLEPKELPSSLVLVPITLTDSEAGMRRFLTAVAGNVGMSISDESKSQPLSKFQPFSAWWIVEEYKKRIPVDYDDTMDG